MGDVTLIETAEIPALPRGGSGARAQVAEETLRRAIQQNKSVRVILKLDERATGVIAAYRTAAQRVGVGLVTTYGQRRVYTNARGHQASEPSILYFTFTRKPAPANGHTRQPVKVGEAVTTFAHGVEVTK